MNKDLHNIENLFQSGLEGASELPPPRVWEAIGKRLEKDDMVDRKRKTRKLKRLSVLLLFLLFCFGVYQLNTLSKPANSADSEDRGNSAQKAQEHSNKTIAGTNNESISIKGKVSKSNLSTVKAKQTILFAANPGRGNSLENKTLTNSTTNDTSTGLLLSPAKVQIAKLLPDLNFNSFARARLTNSFTIQPAAKKGAAYKRSRISLTAFFSPDFASYRLREDDDHTSANVNLVKNSEKHEFSFTTGFWAAYQVNSRLALQSGLSFSFTEIVVGPKTVYAGQDNTGDVKYRLNLSSGYGYFTPSFQPQPSLGDSLEITAVSHKLQYLSVPVAVRYQVFRHRLSTEAVAGVGINFLTSGKVETEIQQGPNSEIDVLNELQGLKHIYINAQAGLAFRYNLWDRLSVHLMPTVRFALTPINKEGVVKTFPRTAGVEMGLRWKL